MEDIRIIEVKQSVFADNNADAHRLRQQLKEEKAEIAQQIEKLKGQISENQSEMEKMV